MQKLYFLHTLTRERRKVIKKGNNTSDLLEEVMKNHEARDTVTVGELKDAMHERGFGVLMAIAALPLCIPVPVPPGYTTFFSVPLFILAAQMIFGMDSPWLPKWLQCKEIKRARLGQMVKHAAPLLRKIEKLLKPRLHFATSHEGERMIGIFAFIFSLSIAIPLPLTNLPPGYGILIMSLGLLSKDGLTIIIGMITGTVGVILTIFILMLGKKATYAMIDVFVNWFSF